ncbi:MAG: hypothetical protein Q9M11_06840 [Mariprofundaceae bacterium]|nr:hypothetical protein [Mariprofundaceae bacterium]
MPNNKRKQNKPRTATLIANMPMKMQRYWLPSGVKKAFGMQNSSWEGLF